MTHQRKLGLSYVSKKSREGKIFGSRKILETTACRPLILACFNLCEARRGSLDYMGGGGGGHHGISGAGSACPGSHWCCPDTEAVLSHAVLSVCPGHSTLEIEVSASR